MRAMRRRLAIFSVLLLGCPKAIPDGRGEGPLSDGGNPEVERLVARVDAIDAEAGVVLAALDDALWRHWTKGQNLELAKATQGHEALFGLPTLEVLRRAQGLGVESRRAAHLERWILAQALSRALESDTEAVASLEAGATFTLGEKEIPWRDLSRLLINEKSAVKRRALAAGAVSVAERLDGLLAHREDKTAELLAGLSAGSPSQLATATREFDLDAMAATAREVLSATDGTWKSTLQSLSALELKLPLETLTKADLPRLLKVPASVDVAFPRTSVATRAIDTLAGLGLYGRPGLSLELSDGANKRPLPLTVAPSPKDVRVSYKPLGGLRDQTLLLSELGVALALSAASTGHPSTDRLGDPARGSALGALLSWLVMDPAWLSARGVTEAQQPAVIRSARALMLYSVRRAALGVLLHAETVGLGDPEAKAAAVALEARALGVKVPLGEGASLRLELDDGLRSGTTLKAALAAAEVREQLGDRFWASPDAGQALLARWAAGTSTELVVSSSDALVRLLGVSAPSRAVGPTSVVDAGSVEPAGGIDGGAPDTGDAGR